MPNTKKKNVGAPVTTQAERLKAIRKKLELSQEDFARASKISTSLLSKMETGAVEPSLDFTTTLITRWCVNPDYWKGEPGHADVMFTAEPKPVENNANAPVTYESVWRDVALKEVAGERDNLRDEVKRLWGMIDMFMKGELTAGKGFPLSLEGNAA